MAFIFFAPSQFKHWLLFRQFQICCIGVYRVECWQPKWRSQLTEQEELKKCEKHCLQCALASTFFTPAQELWHQLEGKLVLVASVVLWRHSDRNFWLGGLLTDRRQVQSNWEEKYLGAGKIIYFTELLHKTHFWPRINNNFTKCSQDSHSSTTSLFEW